MTRSLFVAAALALGVTLMGANTALAGGGHHHHGHHHHGHHGGYHGGYHQNSYPGHHHHHLHYGYRSYSPVVVQPYYFQSQPGCYGGYGSYPGYGGYGPSGIGYINRNFSVWLGR